MWPFRKKKKPIEAPTVPDWADRVQHHLDVQAEMRRRLDEQIARIESAPITRFTWTPVIDGYGRILALAWKNDQATATRLLDEPGQGWA